MKLLTKKLKNQIPRLYSTEAIALGEKHVIMKFINPAGKGAWYVIEGEEQNGDFLFFGLIETEEKMLGYFSLNELESLRLPYGLKIIRDNQFFQDTLSNIVTTI
jgi:hypothetical protein